MSAPAKTIEVDPTDEGPKVRPKRQMTEAQLAALKKGREKLAEKRKQQEQEQEQINSELEVSKQPQSQEQDAEHIEDDDAGYAPLCRIM